jgi:hypothetical protein
MKPFFVALLLAISSMQVCAQPAAVIEGVQTPAGQLKGKFRLDALKTLP